MLVAASLTLASGCAVEDPPPSDPELRAALGISDEVVIHRVDLGGGEGDAGVSPDSLVVRPGDLVQFVVLDHRVHRVTFPEDRIAPPLLDYLAATAQDRPPPLVDRGARLVLSFDDAPVGVYPFEVVGNGPAVTGEIRVAAP